GIVDVEREVEGAAAEPDPRDGDLLQPDVGVGEGEAAEGGARERQSGNGRQKAVEGGRGHRSSRALRFSSSHQSMRSFTVFSYPISLGSYHFAPRSGSGR